MARFLGGSAYAMANQVSEGYVSLTPATLKRFGAGELNQLHFELNRILTDLRGNQPIQGDTSALKAYHHRTSRVRGAMQVVKSQMSRK